MPYKGDYIVRKSFYIWDITLLILVVMFTGCDRKQNPQQHSQSTLKSPTNIITPTDVTIPISDTPKISFLRPSICLFIEKTSTPPIWTYFVDPANVQLKPGDTVKITGAGITGASVSGDAISDDFGAWTVKEYTDTYAIFEVTKKAFVKRSFGGFSITAPNTVEGIIQALIIGEEFGGYSDVRGPLRKK